MNDLLVVRLGSAQKSMPHFHGIEYSKSEARNSDFKCNNAQVIFCCPLLIVVLQLP